MKRKWLTILIISSLVFVVTYLVGSYNKHDFIPAATSLQQVVPVGFPAPFYRFEDNPFQCNSFCQARLKTFTGYITSSDSKYDLYKRGDASHGYGKLTNPRFSKPQ